MRDDGRVKSEEGRGDREEGRGKSDDGRGMKASMSIVCFSEILHG